MSHHESHDTEVSHFIRDIIKEDLATGKHKSIATRFPPEPNGYLHIGHAKSICLNFGMAKEFSGTCNLRLDDTNPTKENTEYVESIKGDVRWLGFDWGDRLFFASDYFEKLYNYAEDLIRMDKAYVCELSAEETRAYRGTLTEPGKESPYRNRPTEESLDLFRRMRAGEFEDGKMVLRAKIDMSSPNITLRDPTIYRIRRAHHHRTGDAWCIYPMYDFAHCLSDALEGITHSLCTLEFENNRPLYEWFINQLDVPSHPRQIEFARLELTYTVMSKRKLLRLVEEGLVSGWDDPRMPTIAGMRRRGFTPAALRNFSERIGVAKRNSTVDVAMLEHALREDLNATTRRVMGVLDPIKVVIENYPEDTVEELDAPFHPEDDSMGSRTLPFSRELYIERDDFMENPPKKFFRLSPGREVRLRYAYYITCKEVVKDDAGNIVELICTYDPESRGGTADGRKVKATLHWVSAKHAVRAEVRLYDRLFTTPSPEGDKETDFTAFLNPDSLHVTEAYLEPSLASAAPEDRVQFERIGYFVADKIDMHPDKPVFNRIIGLRDTWAKISSKEGA